MKGIYTIVLLLALSIVGVNEIAAQNNQDKALTRLKVDFKRMNLHGLSFRIQIGAYSKSPATDLEAFFNVDAIEAYDMGDGLIRYVSPYNFGDIKTAELQKKEMVIHGVQDAFIVPFYEGNRITYSEAVKLLRAATK